MHFVNNQAMDKNIKRYLKTEYAKGASPLARIMDLAGLRFVVFCAGYFLYLLVTRNLVISLILAGITTFAASLVLSRLENNRFRKFTKKYLHELRQKAMMEELVILPQKKRMKFFEDLIAKHMGWKEYTVKKDGIRAGEWFAHVFDRHPSTEVSEQDILVCLRSLQREGLSSCLCVAPSGYNENAKIFARSLEGYSFELLDKKEILLFARDAGYLPEEETILSKISNQITQKKLSMDKVKAEVFGSAKFKSYVATAIVMAGISVLLHFQPYFMSMAAFCGILAVMTYYYNTPKKVS